ncbi:MAG TPA: hypothetical protein VNI84_10320 [Pyrinomonadaceae bacterium]|nr:hypothetical protein [Pyrinomonadaceae bacterium]
MKKLIRNLIFVSLLFFALALGSISFGYEYDKANKLYPETKWVSYDLAIGNVYGERTQRLAKASFSFGILLDAIAIVIWYRDRKNKDYKILLNENE